MPSPVDLNWCAREPIQIIGQIQPHGLLFALSEPDLIVRQVSANVSTVIGVDPDGLLGRSIEVVLGSPRFETFRLAVASGEPFSAKRLRIAANGREIAMDSVVHRHAGELILELELTDGTHSLAPLDLDAHIRIPLARMDRAADLTELFQIAAEEIRKLSGFDRVMIYRFDKNMNGEVTAEAAGSLPILYLGSRFPESDIPAQARQLFLMTPSRSIADIDAKPAAIVPEFGPATGRPLDLTRSVLRSAAQVHLKYLSNMGVQSSMTLSIVVNQRLWGLVACHSSIPHRLDLPSRSVCELMAQIFASHVALRVDNIALRARLASRESLEEYMAASEAAEPMAQTGQSQGELLLRLMSASGSISRIGGSISYRGVTVSEELLLPAIAKLRGAAVRGIASSNLLAELDPAAGSYASQASGALYIGLAEGTGDYLLLLRRELLETLTWAGNPDKAANLDAQGRLRPRHSFAAWKETVRGQSQPWTELELENASVVRQRLLRLGEALKLRKAEEHVRYLAEYDVLTGLLNRHSIHLKLEECVRDAEARQSEVTVLFIDLDRFKPINDLHGHAAGDRILKVTAQRMQQQVRSGDFVGRLGGDEFIIVIPSGLSLETGVLNIVGRILRAVEEPVEIENGDRVQVTASIGLSRYPIDGATAEALIGRSDKAMYRVKGLGGNAFDLFEAEQLPAA
jgi:diguanylate cyclase (GGDEF)-like protein